MGLTKLALNRPLTMLMIILALVLMGVQGFNRLKLDRFPAVDFPFVTVVTVFPGASPEDVEDLVVKPIEDAVSTISGIDELNSISTEGAGTVVIAFNEGVDGNQAAIDVERQVASVRGELPTEAEDPTIIKADINAIPVIFMALNGPQDQAALFDLADNEIRTQFQAIPGVASVSISGGRDREVQILVDPAKLAAFGVPLGDVQRKLSENNITFPAGSLDEGRQRISVRSVGEFTELDQIRNLVVREPENGLGRVYLSDIAEVKLGLSDAESYIRFNGQEAVSISVIKSSDANTVEVVDRVMATMEDVNAILPPGAELTVVQDNASFVRRSVDAVLEDLFLAIIITGLVILVFLYSVRSTLIVMFAIPTSIISTFLFMWLLGFSLNQLTLLALTLVIGILVDDAIVVIENIERHIDMGESPQEAALTGRAEIGLAAITITLTEVVVYLPVAFTSGIVGQFFYSYGMTIAISALLSLFIAFTLTPMLAGLWLDDKHKPKPEPTGLRKFVILLFKPITWLWAQFVKGFDKAYNGLASLYAATLRFFLWNVATQLLAVVLAVASLAAGIYLVVGGFVNTEFLPQEDDGQIRIGLEMPAGTNLDTTDRVAKQVESIIINNVPETSGILTVVGTGGGGGFAGATRSTNAANINLVLVDKIDRERTTTEVVDAMRALFRNLPDAIVSVTLNSGAGGGGESPVQFRLSGPDPNKLIELSEEVEEIMRNTPGTADVANTDAARSPESRLVVNRQQALDLDLAPASVASTLRTSLSGSTVGKFEPSPGATEIDILLRMDELAREDVTQLLQVPVDYVQDQPILLNRVVDLERGLAPARITRSDRQRVLTVGSGVTGGRGTGDVTNDIETAIQEQMEFPAGYSYQVIGTSEVQRESFAQLGQSILLAILLIYMLLVALFQSWLQPLAIMFSLPVALVGAFGGLALTGNSLNLNSILGIIVLVGVVTKNAILLVDFANNLREQGYQPKDALVTAGRLRLRAVLMTTLTLVFALMPLLIGASAGSESRAPLAAVVVGGVVTSTLLTLILIPVIYNFFDWGSGRLSQLLATVWGSSELAGDQAEPQAEPEGETPEERQPEGKQEKDDKGAKRPQTPRPSPQPGSAMSFGSPE